MQIRIGSGLLKGKNIKTPNSKQTRVTTSLHRKVIFNTLHFALEDAQVLDLFAGSGILGIEALSKGAKFVTFVEKGAKAASVISENIRSLNLKDQCNIWKKDAFTLLERNSLDPFDIIFLDPPYSISLDQLTFIFDCIKNQSLLTKTGVICLETSSQNLEDIKKFFEGSFTITKERVKGETALLFIENLPR